MHRCACTALRRGACRLLAPAPSTGRITMTSVLPLRHMGFRVKAKNRPVAGGDGGSGGDAKAIELPQANEQIRAREVRLVDAAGAQKGVVTTAEAMVQARTAGLDLVMTVAHADPPVCKLMSLRTLARELEAAEKERRRRIKNSDPKEVRFSARIDDHDASVKAGKVIEFLKLGRPVRVVVAFTMSDWAKEEPARREVYAKVVRQVAEAGVGMCDATSLRGERALLTGLFTACSPARAATEVKRVLERLATPIRPLALHKDVDTPEHLVSTALAAAEGLQPGGVPLEELLPPPEVLVKFQLPRKDVREGGPAHGGADEGSKAAGTGELPGEDLGVTLRPKRASKKVKA